MNDSPDAVTVDDLAARAGQKATGYCDVALGSSTVSLPIAIVRGADTGPTLSVTAGIHGGEYVPMVAVRRFVEELDPARLHGTVIASLQSSPQAFAERVAYLNPADGRNLNRSFPGDDAGVPTERLAAWLWSNVISRGDYYVDCHCGDLTEGLDAFAGVRPHGDADIDGQSVDLANCFDVNRRLVMSSNGTTIQAATAAGIPSVLVEVGGQGRWSEHEVDVQRTGLHQVAATIGLTGSPRTRKEGTLPAFDSGPTTSSDHAGLWFPDVAPGEPVTAGQLLGTVEDPFGTALQQVRAPATGVVAYALTSLAVNRGDLVVALARPTEGCSPL